MKCGPIEIRSLFLIDEDVLGREYHHQKMSGDGIKIGSDASSHKLLFFLLKTSN